MKKDITKIVIALILFIISLTISFNPSYINTFLYIASYIIVRIRNSNKSN